MSKSTGPCGCRKPAFAAGGIAEQRRMQANHDAKVLSTKPRQGIRNPSSRTLKRHSSSHFAESRQSVVNTMSAFGRVHPWFSYFGTQRTAETWCKAGAIGDYLLYQRKANGHHGRSQLARNGFGLFAWRLRACQQGLVDLVAGRVADMLVSDPRVALRTCLWAVARACA